MSKTRPATVHLWVVVAPDGVSIERSHDHVGNPLPRSTSAQLPNSYRFRQDFDCGAVLPADIPADRIHYWAADGKVQRVTVPLPEEN